MLFKYEVWIRKLAVFSATLLLILIICQPVNSQIPAAPTPVPIASPPSMLIVQIDSNEQIYIDGQLVAPNIPHIPHPLDDQLSRVVIDFDRSNRCGLVVLSASTTTKYASVVEMIDILRALGVNRIALGFPLNSQDGVLTLVSVIFEINQLSPPTVGSLYPSSFPNCSRQPFEIPDDSSLPSLPPLHIPEIPSLPPLPNIISPSR
ncbi:MAG: hypothetical protein KME15_24380 [Drouetiella hepatica Uher 2000/2452]|jgi:biopolymer transport protein ExbD|uniref:Biopolymer transporter ExbD n=1 Tax=Drouetiella hepatica Uher 2000/2452 TaxID=904376 RepID=A0A951QF88_9CYAN|nr:hypothetical protein [Drouetiella hepatica Uher 2000/2452]